MKDSAWFTPDWLLPQGVKALSTYRYGGESVSPYDSFNLGLHVGDKSESVLSNRKKLPLSESTYWLNQTHSNIVLDTQSISLEDNSPEGDALLTTQPKQVCAIMTADCLPILISHPMAKGVAAVHCGWRSLAQGILTKTLILLAEKTNTNLASFSIWLGPAIGQTAFEVGDEVQKQFVNINAKNTNAFIATQNNKYLADLQQLARNELEKLVINDISAINACTFNQSEHYFSYRREGQTGRMASLIWIE